MAIPIFTVPSSSYSNDTKIINKTIVYSDTILPLKDLGDNLKITKIENINESDFEECLKIIFEDNKDVVFNTIQYSKKNKLIYFYTNKEISTKKWKEINFIEYKPLSNSKEILEEIKRNLKNDKNNSENNISLYDIANLIKDYEKTYDYIIKKYTSVCKEQLKQNEDEVNIIIHGFDYENNELEIAYKDFTDKYKHITLKKENDDLYIVKSEGLYSQKILNSIGNYLSCLYDELIKFKNYKNYKKAIYDIRPVNSNFLVYIGNFGVDIHIKSNSFLVSHNDFELQSNNYNNKYSYNCNSNNLISILKGNEDLLFKKIYVKIDDCPSWIKDDLYKIRKKQIEEEKKIEEERLNEELKYQKKLELKRKIFPWIKK